MTLANKLLITCIMSVILISFSYTGSSFAIKDTREVIQIWKVNQEDNYTYSLHSSMLHHSNVTAIKVFKIFPHHIKRMITNLYSKLENTQGIYLLDLFNINGSVAWEGYSKLTDCDFTYSHWNFTNPTDNLIGGGGCSGGDASGGGSTGCCEGVGSLYDLNNGSQVLITETEHGNTDFIPKTLKDASVIIVDQYDSKGCKEQSYKDVGFGIICNGIYGRATGVSSEEQKYAYEHRNDVGITIK